MTVDEPPIVQDCYTVTVWGTWSGFEGTWFTSASPKWHQNSSQDFEIQDSSEDMRAWAIPRGIGVSHMIMIILGVIINNHSKITNLSHGR